MSVGYDHVDVPALKKRGIPLGYTPNVLTDATADLTVLLTMGAARRMKEGIIAAETGEWREWRPTWLCGSQFSNRTLGVVGLGRIGEAVAHRLKAFGISKVLYCGRSEKVEAGKRVGGEFVSFDRLLAESDFVTIFVNTARGGIVQQDDLVRALEEGLIAGAGLDVTTPEPLPLDNKLLKLPNCIVLPHIGDATNETRERMADMCVDNVLAGLGGQVLPFSIDQKYRVIPHGGVVVDCGAAPGGWTQVAVAKAQKKGLVVAVDLLPMDPVSGAHCIKGDFMSLKVQNKVKALLGRRKADLVCSDMAPSFMGNHMADHARSMELCESALTFAQTVLATNGCFVAKFLMGGTEVEFRRKLQTMFLKVKQEKPDASRKQSTEGFFVALGYRPLKQAGEELECEDQEYKEEADKDEYSLKQSV
ncbi:FtsJ-like methyltransferase-domain-containing protein [Phycomyces nitens]|nr:FtsJ-like methyltransferase-domain-containing protein [Phycomyces nitens]